jgi:chlorophyllase
MPGALARIGRTAWLLSLPWLLCACGATSAAPDGGTGQDATVSEEPDAGDDAAGSDSGENPLCPYRSGSGPYSTGPLQVRSVSLAAGEDGAPVPLLIFAPQDPPAGSCFAVVQFQHGFLLANSYFSEILTRLAADGFVVVAPQMYEPGGLPIGKPKVPEEAALAVQVLAWVRANLAAHAGVSVATERVGLAGHSRGGKVVWWMLKGDPTLAQAVAGIDPVDGTGGPLGGEERVISGPFNFPFPSLVLGTGLGPQGTQPCAPAGDNHVQFYEASAAPATQVVATLQGHLDMLDDQTAGCGLACLACQSGPDKAGMRTLTAGLLAAFFREHLAGDTGAASALTDPQAAPITVTLEWK